MEQTFKSNFVVEDKEMVSLSVYNVGLQKCEPGYQWGPGVRNHFLIHHIVSGCGYYETRGKKYTLHQGDSFLVYPDTEVTYYADEQNPWEYYWVGFAGTDAPSILLSTDFSKETPYIKAEAQRTDALTGFGEFPLHSDNEIKQLLLNIYDARGNSLENSVRMTGNLYAALAYYIRISEKEHENTDTYADYLKKATEYILSNYSYSISVEEIADFVGISRSHLFRIFTTHMGASPKEYLTNVRIQEACSLLKHTNLSITAISKSVGFENNLYFSKAFHKKKGVSPSVYREKHLS